MIEIFSARQEKVHKNRVEIPKVNGNCPRGFEWVWRRELGRCEGIFNAHFG
jgi:hypothetical protein